MIREAAKSITDKFNSVRLIATGVSALVVMFFGFGWNYGSTITKLTENNSQMLQSVNEMKSIMKAEFEKSREERKRLEGRMNSEFGKSREDRELLGERIHQHEYRIRDHEFRLEKLEGDG